MQQRSRPMMDKATANPPPRLGRAGAHGKAALMRDCRPVRVGRPVCGCRAHRAGFSLIELLVVIGILSLLLSIMTASLLQVRIATRSFVCKNKLKTVAFEFIQFADEYAHPWRGDSDQDDISGFRLEDFQERTYGVAEFWKTAPSADTSADPLTVDYKHADHPLMCPSGPGELTKQYMLTMRTQAIAPAKNVSIGFNMRLDQASVMQVDRPVFEEVHLTKRILERAAAPLAFDVDGEEAVRLGEQHNEPILPFFSAPPIRDVEDKYSEGATPKYWFPGLGRHGGQVNCAFIGGYVLSSRTPSTQAGWDWRYQPPPAR